MRNYLCAFFLTALLCSIFITTGFCATDANNITFGFLHADQLHQPAPLVMKNLHLLEKRGYSVQWQEYPNAAVLTEQIMKGLTDFGTGGIAAPITMRSKNGHMIFLASSNAEGCALVVSSDIRTGQDLDGKIIATPGAGTTIDTLRELVDKKYNIKTVPKYMNVTEMPAALADKKIDGFVVWEPIASEAEAKGIGYVLVASHDILPGHQCCALMSLDSQLQSQPDKAGAVLDAYLEALQWISSHPSELIEMISEATKLDISIIKHALTRVGFHHPPFIDAPTTVIFTNYLVNSGKIDKEDMKDPEVFIREMTARDFLEKHIGKINN